VDDNYCCQSFFIRYPRNFWSAVSVGRLVYFFFGRFLALRALDRDNVSCANKLDILYCWVIGKLMLTLGLSLTAVNREMGRQHLQSSLDDRFLTCSGLRYGFFGFAVNSPLCQILFNIICHEFGSPAPTHDTILHCDPLFVSLRQSRTLDDAIFFKI
jgi:hypothetical protein